MTAIAVAHAGHPATGGGWSIVAAVALILAALYVAAVVRARRWRWWRTASWLGGCAVVAGAGSPLVNASTDPRMHMLSHLLLGMIAPIGLVLAAPVTLLLRVCSRAGRRRLVRGLRTPPMRILAHPITGLVLSVGGLAVVLLSPLYATGPVAQQALQLHYLAAGSLLTWALVGPDPAPHRARMPLRVGVLVAAAAGHAVLAKYLYGAADRMAGQLVVDARMLESAALLMYYGADLAELLVAVVLFSSWYRRRGRRAQPAEAAPAPAGRG